MNICCPYCGSALKKSAEEGLPGEKPGESPQTSASAPASAVPHTPPPASAAYKDHSGLTEQYICSGCQMLISSAELDREEKRLGWQSLQASSPNASPNPSEEETLQAAWQLMLQQQWEQALDELFQHGYPWQHAAEFLIYRNICQAAPFYSLRVSDQRPAYAGLSVLANNLRNIEFYEPQDKEQRRQTLQSIYEALLLLIKLPLKCSSGKHKNYKDIMHIKRVECLDIFAYHLENLDSPHHECANLRMAEQLWRTCLDNVKLDLVSGSALLELGLERTESEKKLYATQESAVITIEENIRRVTSELKVLDLSYTPQAVPNIYAPHKFHKTMLACIAGAAIFWTGIINHLMEHGLDISASVIMYVYIFIAVGGLTAWIALYLYKFRPWQKKNGD